MFGAQYFGHEDFGGMVLELEDVVLDSEVSPPVPVSNQNISGALATFYCGQIPLAGAQLVTVVTRTGGGGWSHRGSVTLPKRKTPGFKAPVFKKPSPYRW